MEASCSTSIPLDSEKETLVENIFNDISDTVILGFCFDVHRAIKLGLFLIGEPLEDDPKYEIVDEVGRDVFGQVPLKKQFECICPNCNRNLAASRFAPHLEKCLGMGRNSSRIASKRIANTGKIESSDLDDYDNDSDWNYTSDRKTTKRKKDKNSPRRVRNKPATKAEDVPSCGSASSESNQALYDMSNLEEKKSLLNHVCGVISEHTKKMCTRSQRCPQHTEEQRRSIRNFLLGCQATVEDLIDVDTLDEGEGQLLRIWDNNSTNSSNPSPSESNSTLNGLKKKNDKTTSSKGSAVSKKSRGRTPATVSIQNTPSLETL